MLRTNLWKTREKGNEKKTVETKEMLINIDFV